MKLLSKLALCIALQVSGVAVFGQSEPETTFEKMVDVLSPAPNAAAIIKYGDATLNKNTGVATISIPLYSLKGTKIGTSVSLGYSSGGIRVDEIASRVGMGWSLNAGGVVTRTVRGLTDENNNRRVPNSLPLDHNYDSWKFMHDVTNSAGANSNGYDSEPDLFNFSFDGISGSFVFDGSMNPVQVSQTGLKIEKNFTGTDWNFRITTTEGIKYLFGGTGAVETTKRLTSCGKSFNAYVPTSWYLKKIQHPNGEEINFTYTSHDYEYDNGATQTMYYPGVRSAPCAIPPIAPVTCTNLTKTQGVLLSSITLPNSSSITFNYISRDDCGDKLLTSVYFKDQSMNNVGYFDFTYMTVTSSSAYNNEYRAGNNKTPYLVGLNEKAPSGTVGKTHYFSYIDPEGRPSRLSFSQDHWGYFNGRVNTSFVPLPEDEVVKGIFPDAKANREPQFSYAQKGMLQKIVYPTGGTSTFFYQPNTYSDINASYTTRNILSCDVTGSGAGSPESKYRTFHIPSLTSQYVKLHINCRANGTIPPPPAPIVKGKVTVTKVSDNSILFDEEFLPGDEVDRLLTLPAVWPTGTDYKITMTSWGTMATTLITLQYTPNEPLPAPTERVVGGVRVERIATANPGDQAMVKKYYYGPLDDLNHSSLFYSRKPVYWSEMKTSIACPGTADGVLAFKYYVLNSASVNNIGVFNNSLISYTAVTEGIGENFEGGGTESKFLTGYDVTPQVLWNKPIESAPMSNFSSLGNASPISETVVKKTALGTLVPVKKTEYTYQTDASAANTIYGYAVAGPANEPSEPTPGCSTSGCIYFLQVIMKSYDVGRYHVLSNRITPLATTETLYDENGLNPVTSVVNSTYGSTQHYQLTKTETLNSKGQTIRTTYKYPHDYAGTGDYNAMISNNIISKVVDVKTELVPPSSTAIPVSEVKTNYAHVGSNNYEPVSLEQSVKGNALETEGTIDQYDSKGNILQYKSKNEVQNAIIWGYDYKYPVAKIVGATYAQATAQLTVSMSALQSLDGQSLRDELNHIRTGLPAAQVTTYTYKHLAGISSITDPNNRTNTYTYDEFNRLQLIKDQDGNAIKKNEYVYTTPSGLTGPTLYYNTAVSQSYQCQNCDPGLTGSNVTYIVPAGQYVSTVSQSVVDAQAAADLATNGQLYANMNGSCANNVNCTGLGYKFVSCACELGVKVCEQSLPGSNGTWINYLHYQWSDGSVSPSFTETQPACTGVDKKQIGCVCETGQKICDGVTDNGGGSYTVTYHYKWSDNSTSSPPITETITCTGADKKIINCTCETARKLYVSSVQCGKNNTTPGCCTGMWLCTYYYHWSDGSSSGPFTECSDASCMYESLSN
jgi:hypothetical protein